MERVISISRLWSAYKKFLFIGLVAILLLLYIAIAVLPYVLLGKEPYPGWFLFRLLFLLTILIVCIVTWIKTEEGKKC